LDCTLRGVEVRQIFAHELESAFLVVAELRTHLDLEDYLASVQRQSETGYELWGAFEGRSILGVIGFRATQNLSRGLHLFVDDLVVTANAQKSGVGRALMDCAEREARRHGLGGVYLDSRANALGFFAKLGYAPDAATLVFKKLGP
jgi:GNAT superfamily N-acetyltransferase